MESAAPTLYRAGGRPRPSVHLTEVGEEWHKIEWRDVALPRSLFHLGENLERVSTAPRAGQALPLRWEVSARILGRGSTRESDDLSLPWN